MPDIFGIVIGSVFVVANIGDDGDSCTSPQKVRYESESSHPKLRLSSVKLGDDIGRSSSPSNYNHRTKVARLGLAV